MKITATKEQLDILAAVKEGKSIKVKAYAGSGKTSSIELITRDNPNLSFLYLAYNKAIANEAQDRMPNNCIVSTIHSLAYHGCINVYKAKSDIIQEKLSKYWKARRYLDFLGISDNSPYPKILSEHDVVWVIRETVNNFKLSASEEISQDHIPLTKVGDQYEQYLKDLFLEHAKKVWKSECDLKDISTPMDHNTYLKMWALSKPKLPCTHIIIDECFAPTHSVTTDQGRMTFNELLKRQAKNLPLPKAKSYNEETEQIEFKQITKVFKNSSKNNMLSIKIAGKLDIVCTPNHKFLTFNNVTRQKEWVAAEHLEGRQVILPEGACQWGKSPLTAEALDVVNGSILGDGNVNILSKDTARVRIIQCSKQREYALWKSRFFENPHIEQRINQGYSDDLQTRVQTKAFSFINNGKVDKLSAINSLGLLGLAVFIMDDGSYNKGLRLHTNSFTGAECEALLHRIKLLTNADGKMTKDNRGYYYLSFGIYEADKIFILTHQFFPDCMRYKLPEEYSQRKERFEPTTTTLGFAIASVTSIKPLQKTFDFVCDIEVEDNHNYFVSSNNRVAGEVLVHNCQDSNGAMMGIVQNSGCKTIWCGDQFQAIYGFNGAVDAMKNITTDVTLPLTKSWRFGRKIADQANLILDILEPGHLPLVGNDNIPSVVQPVDTNKPFTILCRTNGYLAELALTLIKTGKKVYVEGGVTQICNDLVALQRIKTGGLRPQKSRYTVFKYFGEVIKESLIDKSIKRDLGLVSKLNGAVESETDLLRKSVLSERFKDKADVILSTAHKAKGLEFDQVIIGNDFDQKISKYDKEELHLMYVSVTRAKKVLQLPEWWYDLVEQLRSET